MRNIRKTIKNRLLARTITARNAQTDKFFQSVRYVIAMISGVRFGIPGIILAGIIVIAYDGVLLWALHHKDPRTNPKLGHDLSEDDAEGRGCDAIHNGKKPVFLSPFRVKFIPFILSGFTFGYLLAKIFDGR